MTEKKFSWLRQFPVFAGTLVGIALTAIGGVMMLNVVLKMYVFGFDEPRYMSDYSHKCTYEESFVPVEKPTDRVKLSPEAKKACVEKEEDRERKRYIRGRKESLVDGLAMLLVGVPFWVIFNRKRKEEQ